MSASTNIRCVLTQKALDAFCDKFHIPDEVHPVLPNQNDTMHERPAGKIGFYTRFFDYANFRLPLSTFLVDGLRHFRINISQLSVIGAAKFLEAFLCLVGLSRYYPLDEETYPRFLHKNGEGGCHMNIFSFIQASDPTKVKIIEREWNEGKPLLLETTIDRNIPLLPVAHDRAESELEASVDRIFDEGGSGNQTKQGDSTGGGKGADIQPVSEPADIVVEDVAPLQPRRQRKRKTVVGDVSESSHPPKRLREDHETPSGTSVGGKSMSAVQRLLAGAVLNAEVRVAAIPTLLFVTASVSTTTEHKGGDHTDSVVEPNLYTIGAPQRFVISSDSSHHSGANVAEAKVDSFVRSSVPIMTTTTTVTPTVDPRLLKRNLLNLLRCLLVLFQLVERILLWVASRILLAVTFLLVFNVGASRQMSLSAEVRMRVEYNVKERRRLKSVVENAQTSNLEAVEKSLRDEVNALKERNAILEKEQNALDVKVIDLEASMVGKEHNLTDLNAQLTFVKSQNDNLVDRVHELEISSVRLQEKITVYDNCMEQLEKFQDDQMKVVNDKLEKLDADLAEIACHLEERFYPHLLNTISGQRWLLTHDLKLFLVKCLNSSEYLTALGAVISRAIEKGMQSGLAAGIDHGREGRSLADVSVYNPDAEPDFNSALQKFREVDFPLLAELKSHKDASMEDIMNVLCLEGALADAPGMNDLQHDIEQLRVPIH
ncbi:hypothetical protein Tco_1532779 [Tanacetum coccineum]